MEGEKARSHESTILSKVRCGFKRGSGGPRPRPGSSARAKDGGGADPEEAAGPGGGVREREGGFPHSPPRPCGEPSPAERGAGVPAAAAIAARMGRARPGPGAA